MWKFKVVRGDGVEPPSDVYKTSVLTDKRTAHISRLWESNPQPDAYKATALYLLS